MYKLLTSFSTDAAVALLGVPKFIDLCLDDLQKIHRPQASGERISQYGRGLANLGRSLEVVVERCQEPVAPHTMVQKWHKDKTRIYNLRITGQYEELRFLSLRNICLTYTK